MNAGVVELVTYQLKPETQEAAFLAAVEQSNQFLRTCAGFVERRVARETGLPIWLDMLFWQTMEQALSAAAQFNHQPETEAFNNLIDRSSAMMTHFDVRAEFTNGAALTK
ncbi:MAG: hypothetical protein P4M01_04185 [Acidobacteriota bacterium]|nr:hypothetical protein [Acidobacteriota bacterium]